MFGFVPNRNACRLQELKAQERAAASLLPLQSTQRRLTARSADAPVKSRSSG
jgi:hypothetical protein